MAVILEAFIRNTQESLLNVLKCPKYKSDKSLRTIPKWVDDCFYHVLPCVTMFYHVLPFFTMFYQGKARDYAKVVE
jgi:hypothetical protein